MARVDWILPAIFIAAKTCFCSLAVKAAAKDAYQLPWLPVTFGDLLWQKVKF